MGGKRLKIFQDNPSSLGSGRIRYDERAGRAKPLIPIITADVERLFVADVELIWRIQDNQCQILALAFRYKSVQRSKVFPLLGSKRVSKTASTLEGVAKVNLP